MLCLLLLFISEIKSDFLSLCINFHCDDVGEQVCGIRNEGNGYKLRLFRSECDLLRYGCEVGKNLAFGIINIEYCTQAFNLPIETYKTNYCSFKCSSTTSKVCGIKNDGEGFRVRIFENECHLRKLNCEINSEFTVTDFHICNSVEVELTTQTTAESNVIENISEFYEIEHETTHISTKQPPVTRQSDEIMKPDFYTIIDLETITQPLTTTIESDIPKNEVELETTEQPLTTELNTPENDSNFNKTDEDLNDKIANNKFKNIFAIDSSMIDINHINQTIDDFFAATHVFDLPVKEISGGVPENTRRRLEKSWGPVKVFKPWIIVPKNISNDFDHRPTLSSCYHKCPRKCPDTYAPVCGVPGTVAREPVLMFQNHCYMDVAQCKMYWENKSPTAISSSYQESTFLFCLGDQMHGVFRFLPLIRTLQHMGRLKAKGNYHYKFKNMKFFNERLQRQLKLMG